MLNTASSEFLMQHHFYDFHAKTLMHQTKKLKTKYNSSDMRVILVQRKKYLKIGRLDPSQNDAGTLL